MNLRPYLISNRFLPELLSFALFLTFCQGCNQAGNMRGEVLHMDSLLVQALSRGDVEAVKKMASDTLIRNAGSNLDSLVLQSGSTFPDSSFYLLYGTALSPQPSERFDTLEIFTGTDSAFTLALPVIAATQELRMMVLHNRYGSGFLLTALYGRKASGPELELLQIGPYSLDGKTAPALHREALRRYEKGWTTDAVNYSSLAMQCLRPAGTLMRYNSEAAITSSYSRYLGELSSRYRLPYTLSRIKTAPRIFRIYPEISKEGFFPMVHYLTQIPLSDSARIRLEYQQVRMEAAREFPGLDQEKKYVFYRAFREVPEGNKKVEQVSFVDLPEK